MAYISADDVKAIRNALKEKFPKFKFGCKKGSGSLSVDVTIKSGPIDFISNYNRVAGARFGNDPMRFRKAEGELQINQFWFKEHFDGEAQDMLRDVLQIIKSAPSRGWYDNSDAMTDYFDTAYYIHLNVGKWDQPYALSN